MPYCPKCDMEFVEGVSVCSDCGGPLYQSKKDAELAEEMDRYERVKKMREEGLLPADNDPYSEDGEEDAEQKVKAPVRQKTYVKKSQRYEDMKSSVSAFLLVGAILGVFAALCWSGILDMPMAGFSKYMIQGVITVMAAGCFVVAFSTNRSAKNVFSQIEEEERQTAEILDWFVSSYRKEELDARLTGDFQELSGEELSLKRFELIQDILVTNRDLPDQAYVDALCEDIYAKIFEADV